ncbi:hypothetical protein CRG98_029389 [Punica granatum]|uniref:Endonuclease/exonuclease/phosphatase domain-containing protein n=1 Tax=Punica granatum TaxID=22663 RepID=A0A2I0J3A5_PUNGR|nr:hypothetical protein CRG98_029389 [Punica granatum]
MATRRNSGQITRRSASPRNTRATPMNNSRDSTLERMRNNPRSYWERILRRPTQQWWIQEPDLQLRVEEDLIAYVPGQANRRRWPVDLNSGDAWMGIRRINPRDVEVDRPHVEYMLQVIAPAHCFLRQNAPQLWRSALRREIMLDLECPHLRRNATPTPAPTETVETQLIPLTRRLSNVPVMTATSSTKANIMMILPRQHVHTLLISATTWPLMQGGVETSLQLTPVTDPMYSFPYMPMEARSDHTTNMTHPNLYHMNTLAWNCRVGNASFRRALRDLISNYHPDIMVLTETRLSGDRAARTASSFPFDGFYCTETRGPFGGIWIMWKTDRVQLDISGSTD